MIRIDENYGVDIDKCNYILKRIKVSQGNKHKGEEYTEVVGYYHDLVEALKRYGQEKVRYALKDGSMTLSEAVDKVSKTWDMVSVTIREAFPEYEVTPVKN